MNDPSKFGMAKSFFTAGTAAGFGMLLGNVNLQRENPQMTGGVPARFH